MNAIEKSITRHRRGRGAAWYADHWQGPHPYFSAGHLNQRTLQAADDMVKHLQRLYSSSAQWITAASGAGDLERAASIPLGMAVAVAAVMAPEPVDRRGFLARALAGFAGAASALLPAPPVLSFYSRRTTRPAAAEFRGHISITDLLKKA